MRVCKNTCNFWKEDNSKTVIKMAVFITESDYKDLMKKIWKMKSPQTVEEYKEVARLIWEHGFPSVTGFLDWTKSKGYYDMGSTNESAKEETGERWRETIRVGSPETGFSVGYSLRQTMDKKPKNLKSSIFKDVFRSAMRQKDGKDLAPLYVVEGVGKTATAAFCSLLGLSEEDYSTGPIAKSFRDGVQAYRLKLMSEPASFEFVSPLVATVSEILEKGVQAYMQRLEGKQKTTST